MSLGNFDARLRLKIREEIRRLVKEVGITIIFVTYDQEERYQSVINYFIKRRVYSTKMMNLKTLT